MRCPRCQSFDRFTFVRRRKFLPWYYWPIAPLLRTVECDGCLRTFYALYLLKFFCIQECSSDMIQ